MVAGFKFSSGQPIELSIPPGQELQGRIHIGGNVTTPGFYPFTTGDSLEAFIQAAGGTTGSANLSGVLDANVSQYVYVSLILGAAFPNGRYGAGDLGSFGRFEHRVIYDFTEP